MKHCCTMPNVMGLSSVLVGLVAFTFQCILGQECSTDRPLGIVKQFECAQCKKSENVAETCYEPFPCRWCCECPPGTYVVEHCTRNNVRQPIDTRCEFCEPGFYTSKNNNASSCNESKSKDFCKRLPYTKFVQGSIREDNKCVCIDGTYSSDPETAGCKNHHQCPQGFGVKVPGNGTHDVECEHCPDGKCSDEISSTQRCQICDKLIKKEAAITSIFTSSRPSTTIETFASEPPSAEPSTSNETIVLYVVIGVLVFVIVGFCITGFFMRKQIKRACCPEDPEISAHPDANGNEHHNLEGLVASGSGANGTSGRNRTARTGTTPTPELQQPEQEPLLDPQDSNQQPEQTAGHYEEEEHRAQQGSDSEEIIDENNSSCVEKNVHNPPPKKEGPVQEGPEATVEASSCPTKIFYQKSKTSNLPAMEKQRESNEHSSPPRSPSAKKENKGTVKKPSGDDDNSMEISASEFHEEPEAPVEAVPCRTEDPDLKSKCKLDEDQYNEIFFKKGYQISFNPDQDGNCQFSAMCFLSYPGTSAGEINEEAKKLRHDVVEYIRTHPKQFKGFAEDNLNAYITKMSSDGEYGDDLTLHAASEILRKTFKIIQTSNEVEPPIIAPTNPAQSQPVEDVLPVLLGHVDENHGSHYVCLVPISSDEIPPFAQTPMSDIKVEQDLQAQSENSHPPSQLEISLTVPEPTPEQARPPQQEPSSSAVSSEHGADTHQQGPLRNGVSGGLELFKHEEDKAVLRRVDPDVLESALRSENYLHQMLYGPHGLCKHVITRLVKKFIREYELIEKDTPRIEDIEIEHTNQEEIRTKLLKRVQAEQGRGFTPQKIMELAVAYETENIYDVLCIAFIKHMQKTQQQCK